MTNLTIGEALDILRILGNDEDLIVFRRKKLGKIMIDLTIDEALEILRVLGSDEDPIIFRGIEITPNDIEDYAADKVSARYIHIKYFGKKGRSVRMKKGTLIDMLKDRLGIK